MTMTTYIIDTPAEDPPLAIPMMTIEDVAHLINVSQAQVRRWINAGKFPNAVRLPGRGHWRVPVADYESFIRAHQRSSAGDSATASGG
jgi:excisionase family DNA binding protein